MAQYAPANRARAAARMGALDRSSGDGQRHSQGNRVAYRDRPAAAGLSADEARGAPPGLSPSLNRLGGYSINSILSPGFRIMRTDVSGVFLMSAKPFSGPKT